jgi:hypothetical protein
LKESRAGENASNGSEDPKRVCDVQEFDEQLQHEEILR